MIPEADRYQGVVLRQLLVAKGRANDIRVVNIAGRIDAFAIDGAAFLIKHSGKRLSPWQFTFADEHLQEADALSRMHDCAWVFLVCGSDGVVGLSVSELKGIVRPGQVGSAWVRVERSRRSMYRVSGSLGELHYAKARGVQGFLADAFGRTGTPTGVVCGAPTELRSDP